MTSPQNSDFLTPLPPLVTQCHLYCYNPSRWHHPKPYTPPSPVSICTSNCSSQNHKMHYFEDFFIMFVFIKQYAKKFLKLAFKKAIFFINLKKSPKIEIRIVNFVVSSSLEVTSPLLKMGSLPLSPLVTFLGSPHPPPLGWRHLWMVPKPKLSFLMWFGISDHSDME